MMIIGRVNEDYGAEIPIALPDFTTRELHHFAAMIDTGFDGYLMLPRAVVQQLGLTVTDTRELVLGDEQRHRFDVCVAVILWEDEPMPVPVVVSETQTLVGARLLAGYYLTAAMIPGGRVTLTGLP